MSGFVQSLFWFARDLGRASYVDTSDGQEKRVSGISCAAVKAIGARIGDACNDDGAAFRPLAKAWLAEDTGYDARVVQRALGRLRELGILAADEPRSGRGQAPVYSIDVDRVADFIPRDRLPRSFARRLPEREPHCIETNGKNKGDVVSPQSGEGETQVQEGETSVPEKGGMGVSPQQDPTNHSTTPRATAGEGASPRRATGGSSGGRERRRSADEDPAAPKPPKIQVPAGWEGELIEAALASKDPKMPWKLKPWLGRFRLLEIEDADGRWQRKLAVDGNEHDFRSVFTGAMIALDCRSMQIYFPAFAARQISKGKARWVNREIAPKWFGEALRAVAPANEGVRQHG